MRAKKLKNVTGKKQQIQTSTSFGVAITNFFAKYAVFSGTATRSEYGYSILFLILVFAGLSVVEIILCSCFSDCKDLVCGLSIVAAAVLLLPYITVTSRRLHDVGHPIRFYFGPRVMLFLFYKIFPLIHVPMQMVYIAAIFVELISAVVLFGPSKFKNNKYRK